MSEINRTNPTEQENKILASMKRSSIIWGILFVVVMIAVACISVFYIASLASEFTNAIETLNATQEAELTITRNHLLSADYLAIIIPVLVALAGSFVAFLGMSRLKMFDDRIDKIRSDMLEEMEKLVKSEVSMGRAAFESDLISKINSKEEEIKAETEKGIKLLQEEHLEKKKAIEQTVNDFGQRYDWLEAMISAEVGELDIATVADAHSMVETLQEKKPSEYIQMISKIVDKVCAGEKQEFLSGDSKDYHNLSAELARRNMYSEAIRVLEKGISLFATDVDLLSDKIEYTTKNSEFEKARDAVATLLKIDKKGWSWRCYEFTVDYYRAIGQYQEAYNLCSECTQSLPYDEHAFRSKAELEMIITPGETGITTAIATLEDVMSKGIPASQCAQLLSILYFNKGMLKESIDKASKAINDLAEDQPSIEMAVILSKRGFAYDKLYMQEISEGKNDSENAELAINDYKMSLSLANSGLSQLSPITIKQILIRLAFLEQFRFDEKDAEEQADV